MARKRGNREGSIYKRADGRWAATVDLGWYGGKRRRKTLGLPWPTILDSDGPYAAWRPGFEYCIDGTLTTESNEDGAA